MTTLSPDAVEALAGLQPNSHRRGETPRERWIFTFELPSDVTHPGRFVARVLKHLLRAWGIRATVIHAEPHLPSATPTSTQAEANDAEAGEESSIEMR
jgi:hypothetical protein